MAAACQPRMKAASKQSKSKQAPNSQDSEDESDPFEAGMSFCSELTVVVPPNSNQRRTSISLPYANNIPLLQPGIIPFQILC